MDTGSSSYGSLDHDLSYFTIIQKKDLFILNTVNETALYITASRYTGNAQLFLNTHTHDPKLFAKAESFLERKNLVSISQLGMTQCNGDGERVLMIFSLNQGKNYKSQ